MFFLKKVILGIAAFVFILWGGAGTQSNNLLLQGGGFIGLIVGLLFYIYLPKWPGGRWLPAVFSYFQRHCLFCYLCHRRIQQRFYQCRPEYKDFYGAESAPKQSAETNGALLLVENENVVSENFADGENIVEETEIIEKEPAESGPIRKWFNSVTGQDNEAAAPLNPNNFPAIYGSAKVINGDTLKINGYYFRLYGIDAPESQSDLRRSSRTVLSLRC